MKDIITSPKYLKRLAPIYTKDFFKQIMNFDIGPLTPMREGSPVENVLKFRISNDLKSFQNTKQYIRTLEFALLNKFQFYLVSISFLLSIILLCLYKKFHLNKKHIVLIGLLYTGILGNAFTVEIFSTVLNRYQARIIWIIPLITFFLITKYLRNMKRNQTVNSENLY